MLTSAPLANRPAPPRSHVAPATLAVAVVNYNTREHLRACLESVRALGAAEVVVADNASTDGSAEMVRAEFPDAVLLANADNPGYGAAANRAIAACRAPYVLLLNSDTRVLPGALGELARYLDANPRAAVVGPRLETPDGSLQPSCFPFPGTWAWFVENDPVAPLARWLPGARRGLRFRPPTAARSVPWVLGAALAIRCAAWEEVSGFDERFHMYYEEVDLCYRLAAAGWHTHYAPAARVTHEGGASTSQRRAEMRMEHFASTLRFYRTHYTGARRAVWVGMMRAKLLGRLLRDSVRLRTTRDAAQLARLEENVAAWRRSLREQWEPEPNGDA